ncbi:PorP/SprF family type IX secretion system membrane protein [Halocola ammonii]
MKKLLVAISMFFAALVVRSQDIHFSQFFNAPANYNPALTGQFDGDYRFIGNQRTQWRAVTEPYSTIGGSVDANSFLENENLGTGLSIYRDRAGDSRLTLLHVNLAGSYRFALSGEGESLSLGGQVGITHHNIDYSQLEYNSQYNGFFYDPGQPSGEAFSRDSRTYLNFNIGAAYFKKFDERNSLEGGMSVFNLNSPNQSFFNATGVNLDPRLVFHGKGQIEIDDEWDILPSAIFQSQGKFTEFVFGGAAKYILENEAGLNRAVYGGLYYRTRDAGYIMAAMDYDAWHVGISYDINLSDLRTASNGRGGFEIAVIYILQQFKPEEYNYRVCPDYL